MATPIPVYTSVAEVNAAIELTWPDNATRLIDPLALRSVTLGIVKYVTDYLNYKPEMVPFTNVSTVTIPLSSDRLQQFGYIPTPYVFMGDDTDGWQLINVPWSIDKAPDLTTQLIVQVGGPSSGFIILK